MNSSVRAMSSLRQSTSLAGSADDSRAVLATLRVAVGARGDAGRASRSAILSRMAFAAAFSPRGGDEATR
jgi:hypothetical protein